MTKATELPSESARKKTKPKQTFHFIVVCQQSCWNSGTIEVQPTLHLLPRLILRFHIYHMKLSPSCFSWGNFEKPQLLPSGTKLSPRLRRFFGKTSCIRLTPKHSGLKHANYDLTKVEVTYLEDFGFHFPLFNSFAFSSGFRKRIDVFKVFNN